MNIITSLTDQPNQQMTIVLPDGTSAQFTLNYRVQQAGWFYDLSWDGMNPTFVSQGNRLVTSPNALRSYRNQINFGMLVSTMDGGEPVSVTDFTIGYSTLAILDSDDVAAFEATYFPGLPL